VRRLLPARPTLFDRIPVRWRISITTAGLTLLILVCFALVLGQVVGNRIRSDFREELSSAARSLAAETRVSNDAVLGAVVSSPPLRAFALPEDAQIKVLDQYGHGLAGTNPDINLGPPTSGIHDTGNLMVATEPITATGSLPAYVQYARPADGINDTVARVWFFLGAGVLGGTMLALLAGLAVADRAMRPIKSLTGLARQITSTRDPSKRIPEPAADDEVGELARTLDGMLQALDEARSEREQAPGQPRAAPGGRREHGGRPRGRRLGSLLDQADVGPGLGPAPARAGRRGPSAGAQGAGPCQGRRRRARGGQAARR
jgi:two-component system, OmpR family, sensor kinase